MTHRIRNARLLLLQVAAFSLATAFETSGADLNARLPKAGTRPVDFAAEVKPLLERSCAQCHSGEKPKGKFSVETREGILKGGESKEVSIVPGRSGSSALVHLVAGLVPEMEMPPIEKRKKFAALTPDEIGILRAWIDQGAKWPDGVKIVAAAQVADKDEPTASTETPKHDPLFDHIRAGNRRAIANALKNPRAAVLRDEEGNTPLIQAAFYLDAAQVAPFIDHGADINATNNAGLTPLMKAVWDLDKTRLLIQRGANVNAASKNGNTPLISASFAHGSSEIVKALIKAGAHVDAANGLGGNAVVAAAEAGDVNTLRVLLDHRGDPDSRTHVVESGSEATAMMIAAQKGHTDCVKLLLERGAKLNLRTEHGNALNFAAFCDRREVARLLLDRGIDVDVPGQRVVSFRRGDKGFTPLIYACLSERNDPTLVKWLIERGADVNAKASTGETALSVAQQRGNTKIVATLLAAGAKMDEPQKLEAKAAHWNADQVAHADVASLREAVKDGVSVILKSGAKMTEATGNRCASCHQQSIPAIAWGKARDKRFEYPEQLAKEQLAASLKGSGMFAGMAVEMPLPVPNIASWYLMGLDGAGYKPDAFTDKFAYTLARYQYDDGRWVTKASRAPTDYSDVTSTAAAIRALKLYAPPTMKNRIDRNLAKAARWLRSYEAQSTEERAMQILGLHWAGVGKSETDKLAQELLAEQRADGGWAQLSTLESDAYATGLALYALKQADAIPASAKAYQRGAKFLLKNQLADGSWWVKTRVSPVQAAIDDIFPHGKDQWISTVATSWASIALMYAAEAETPPKLTAAQ
ncbi:MAG TPA: ankyrin repeat domain-containing protein [Verrucomicrobiae bacterium]|nr:ankyrin repeat domain-containing protein [Verrucomicrobiae bacterium]